MKHRITAALERFSRAMLAPLSYLSAAGLPCSGVVQSGCDVQIVYGIRAPEVRQAVERRLNRVVC